MLEEKEVQQFQQLVREVVKDEVNEALEPIKKDISDIKSELLSIKLKLDELEERLKRLEESSYEDRQVYGKDIIEMKDKIAKLEQQVRDLQAAQ